MSGELTRRQTLVLGAAGAVLGAAPALAAPRPVLAIYDGRYSDARRFAERAVRAGAASFDARDDLVRLWRHLDARPWRIVALTTPADFGLGVAGGGERGLMLAGSGMHDGRAGAGLDHSLDGFSEADLATRLGSRDWPTALAELMMKWEAEGAGAVCFRTARAADHPGTLSSWRLA